MPEIGIRTRPTMPPGNGRGYHRNQQEEAPYRKSAKTPGTTTGPNKTHAVDGIYRGCGAPAGSRPQVKVRSPKFNVPGWLGTTSPGSGNAFEMGSVWLSNLNRHAMVSFGDGGGNCTQATPIGIDPRSTRTFCGGNQGENAIKASSGCRVGCHQR